MSQIEIGSAEDQETVWVVCDLVEVSHRLPSEYATVVLQDQANPKRRIEIVIGVAEATAIAATRERVNNPRPSTHELFRNVLGSLRVDVVAARIFRTGPQRFSAKLVLMAPGGSEAIDARASDAIALCLGQSVAAPLLVSEASFL
jgi:bifunctional DNase/RNase